MARPREFDIDKAITDAMAVFWTHGYEDSSLPQLLEGTGLSRGSLYKAFSGKQQLFVQALRCYAENEVLPAGELLNDPKAGTGIERIEKVFMAIPKTVQKGDTRGCLLCSAASGRAVQEPAIAAVIHELLSEMENGFSSALKASEQNHDGLAKMLVAQYIGLRTLSRAGSSPKALEESVKALINAIAR